MTSPCVMAAIIRSAPKYRKNKATFHAVLPAPSAHPPPPCSRWCPRLGVGPHAPRCPPGTARTGVGTGSRRGWGR